MNTMCIPAEHLKQDVTEFSYYIVTNGSQSGLARLGNTKAGTEIQVCIKDSIATNTKREIERRNKEQMAETGRQDR